MLFGRNLHEQVVNTGIAGEIGAHHDDFIHLAIRQVLLADPYFTFGVKVVDKAVRAGTLGQPELVSIMAESLGISTSRFLKKGPGYISPDLAIARIDATFDLIDKTIAEGKTIMLATGHPGSMLSFYLSLERYISQHAGKLYQLPKSTKIGHHHWIDSVRSVLVVSDLGGLVHTHEHEPMAGVLKHLKGIGLVIADHGFAGAAINAGIPTAGIHDVDDPGIPIAAFMKLPVLAVPMNDNQLNVRTDRAIRAVLKARGI